MIKVIKKVILSMIVIVIIIGIVIVLKPDKRYRKYIIEKECLEFLNTGEAGKFISERSKKEYEYAITNENNKYNIDEFVKAYVDYISKCVLKKKGENISFNDYFVRANYWILGIYKINRSFCEMYSKFVLDHIGQDEINSIDNGTFEKELINELEKKFIHNSVNDYEEWYIEGNKERTIELPYGFYLQYYPNDKKNNRKLLKAIKFEIIDKTGMTPSLNKYSCLDCIDNSYGKGKVEFQYKLKYKDINGKTEVYNGLIYLNDSNDVQSYSLSCINLLYTQSKKANIEMNNHDYDAWSKEREEHELEVMRQEEEADPSTVLVNQYGIDIEMFKKYNQFASIMTNVYKDGSTTSYFKKCILTKLDNGKNHEEYMMRELPYKNKTIEEVMELYINDKEQYSIDEELLKNGNALVEYESYILP